MADFPLYGAGSEILSYGADTATSEGTKVTASVTANTKGAWAELTASTGFDLQGFLVSFSAEPQTGQPNLLLDIGVGGGGSEEIIFEDLLLCPSSNYDSDFSKFVYAPVRIGAGIRVAARCQGTVGSEVINISLNAVPSAFTSMMPGSNVIAFGANTADSGGISVDPGGTANTKGAWTEIDASTSDNIKGIWITQATVNNTANRVQRCMYDVAIGGSGSEEIIAENLIYIGSQQETVFSMPVFFPIDVPSGSRLAIRAQTTTTDATDRIMDHVIYGVI